ncbi:hypothetical protein RB2150_02704 [Rhodobacteraceae bacterium HTCC2150]|nr:hypothetical protein RB2150_02704 [Rhodobacteraceae bacterium HTCC2150]
MARWRELVLNKISELILVGFLLVQVMK